MDKSILEIIRKEYNNQDQQGVIDELSSITLKHVMAESEFNLRNTRLAVLQLSNGNLKDLKRYVQSAKRDFRDVIYWASMELRKAK